MNLTLHTTPRAAQIAALDQEITDACIERRMQDAWNILQERRAVESLSDVEFELSRRGVDDRLERALVDALGDAHRLAA